MTTETDKRSIKKRLQAEQSSANLEMREKTGCRTKSEMNQCMMKRGER